MEEQKKQLEPVKERKVHTWKTLSRGKKVLVVCVFAIEALIIVLILLPSSFWDGLDRYRGQRQLDLGMKAIQAEDFEAAAQHMGNAGPFRWAGEAYLAYEQGVAQGASEEEQLQLLSAFFDWYTEESAGSYAALYNETRDSYILAYLKDHEPYPGMSTKYINKTKLGPCDSYVDRTTKLQRGGTIKRELFYWLGENHMYMSLVAVATDGQVDSFRTCNEGLEEKTSGSSKQEKKKKTTKRSSGGVSGSGNFGNPEPGVRQKAHWRSSSGTTREEKDDAYEARDYDNPEDFFEENADEFDNYDEAADEYYDMNDE